MHHHLSDWQQNHTFKPLFFNVLKMRLLNNNFKIPLFGPSYQCDIPLTVCFYRWYSCKWLYCFLLCKILFESIRSLNKIKLSQFVITVAGMMKSQQQLLQNFYICPGSKFHLKMKKKVWILQVVHHILYFKLSFRLPTFIRVICLSVKYDAVYSRFIYSEGRNPFHIFSSNMHHVYIHSLSANCIGRVQ